MRTMNSRTLLARYTSYVMRTLFTLVFMGLSTSMSTAQQGVTHELLLAPENIHWGFYDGSLEPAVTIQSGDKVYVENLLARGLGRLRLAGISEDRFLPSMLEVERAETVRVGAHPLNGPIYVEGAESGDVLEVRILDVGFMVDYGVSGFLPGGGTIPSDFPYAALKTFEIDTTAWTISMSGVDGVQIPARPFFGSIGVAPPVLNGRISSNPPAYRGEYRQQGACRGDHHFSPGTRRWRTALDWRWTRCPR